MLKLLILSQTPTVQTFNSINSMRACAGACVCVCVRAYVCVHSCGRVCAYISNENYCSRLRADDRRRIHGFQIPVWFASSIGYLWSPYFTYSNCWLIPVQSLCINLFMMHGCGPLRQSKCDVIATNCLIVHQSIRAIVTNQPTSDVGHLRSTAVQGSISPAIFSSPPKFDGNIVLLLSKF